jgi:hypothetical protein
MISPNALCQRIAKWLWAPAQRRASRSLAGERNGAHHFPSCEENATTQGCVERLLQA